MLKKQNKKLYALIISRPRACIGLHGKQNQKHKVIDQPISWVPMVIRQSLIGGFSTCTCLSEYIKFEWFLPKREFTFFLRTMIHRNKRDANVQRLFNSRPLWTQSVNNVPSAINFKSVWRILVHFLPSYYCWTSWTCREFTRSEKSTAGFWTWSQKFTVSRLNFILTVGEIISFKCVAI